MKFQIIAEVEISNGFPEELAKTILDEVATDLSTTLLCDTSGVINSAVKVNMVEGRVHA